MTDSSTDYAHQIGALVGAITGDDGRLRAALQALDADARGRLAVASETLAAACRAYGRGGRAAASEIALVPLDTIPADVGEDAEQSGRRWFRVDRAGQDIDHYYVAHDTEGDGTVVERTHLYATRNAAGQYMRTDLADRERELAPYLPHLGVDAQVVHPRRRREDRLGLNPGPIPETTGP